MDGNDCFFALLPTDLLLRLLSTPATGARDLAACGATCRLFRQIPAGASGSDALLLTEAAASACCLRIFREAHFQVTFFDVFLALPTCPLPCDVADLSVPPIGGWYDRRTHSSAYGNVVTLRGSSSSITYK